MPVSRENLHFIWASLWVKSFTSAIEEKNLCMLYSGLSQTDYSTEKETASLASGIHET